MSLLFFADHCVPHLVVQSLREAGHEALRLREHIPPESPDPVVIATAQELDAILVSLNGVFPTLSPTRGRRSPDQSGPFWLRPLRGDAAFPAPSPRRRKQKVEFRGELFPADSVADPNTMEVFLDFFQTVKEDGSTKGIVAIDLRRFP